MPGRGDDDPNICPVDYVRAGGRSCGTSSAQLTRYGLALTQFSIRALAPIHTSIHTCSLFGAFGRPPTPKIRSPRASATPLANLHLLFQRMMKSQQRLKARRGLSSFSCCAILLRLNSAKTVHGLGGDGSYQAHAPAPQANLRFSLQRTDDAWVLPIRRTCGNPSLSGHRKLPKPSVTRPGRYN